MITTITLMPFLNMYMNIFKYCSKEAALPVLIFYIDAGPKHQTTFLSIKIALICLQKYLDLDQVLAVPTPPDYSYHNPAEKINCLLNIGLYGTGCMRQYSPQCSGLSDI